MCTELRRQTFGLFTVLSVCLSFFFLTVFERNVLSIHLAQLPDYRLG